MACVRKKKKEQGASAAPPTTAAQSEGAAQKQGATAPKRLCPVCGESMRGNGKGYCLPCSKKKKSAQGAPKSSASTEGMRPPNTP